MAINIIITDAGRAAIVDAENTGTDPVTIAEVGIGNGSYSTAPDATATALKAEIKRLSTIAGEIVADDTFHVTVKDEGNDVYDMTEFGLYLADGTLFAIYAVTSGTIAQKAAASAMLLATDIVLTTVNATSITFGDTSFTNPPASTTVPGVTKYADNTQTQTGTADNLAVTPAGLSSRTATETRSGLSKVATQAQVDAGTDDSFFVTSKKLAARLASVGRSGQVAAFAMSSPPTGWLKANGAAVSRNSYADLFTAIGTTFGSGDGSTTFNLPDLRGEFVRGLDDGRGIDGGRLIGTAQSDALESHNHYLPTSTTNSISPSPNIPDNLWNTTNDANEAPASGKVATTFGTSGTTGTFSAETRPRNVALLYCIKY